jgi:hypothetical protein
MESTITIDVLRRAGVSILFLIWLFLLRQNKIIII